ncbi:MAG: amino acid racemase [Candidatus Aminicenantes bacterium]|nr:amino acid racemase [Candidatus Aminicenantes bacterium]MBL7082678.1 amino acid racemase [Candidatus Aminicenantes bacterium]
MKKTIGILGGMGPEATAYFFELIVKNTKAEKDQEHIHVVIESNPEIPPRTDAVLEQGESPLPYLIEGVRTLRGAGVDFIVMPCVTAHYYYNEIVAQEKISFLNLLNETLLYAVRKIPELKIAGLISSTGTLKAKLFHETFEKEGIEVINPNDEEQEKVMEAIFGAQGIKAGFRTGSCKEIIHGVAETLIRRGAEAVIAGCTEVPLVLKEADISVPLIEPLQILAEASILMAGYEVKS